MTKYFYTTPTSLYPARQGEPVGFIVDQSADNWKGPNLFTGWPTSGSSGLLRLPDGSASVSNKDLDSFVIVSVTSALITGKTYELTFTADPVAGEFYFANGSAQVGGFNSSGTHVRHFTATSSSLFLQNAGTSMARIRSLSIREVTGTNARQATAMSQPLLVKIPQGGIHNLISDSQNLVASTWTVATGSVSPNGIIGATATAIGQVNKALTGLVNDDYLLTFRCKGITSTSLQVTLTGATSVVPSKTSGPGIISGASTNVNVSSMGYDKWSYVTIKFKASGTLTLSFKNQIQGATSGLMIDQVQLIQGNTAKPLQVTYGTLGAEQVGGSNLTTLYNDGGDSMPVTMTKPGHYTMIWIGLGGVVGHQYLNLTGTTVVETLKVQNQLDCLLVPEALKLAEVALVKDELLKTYKQGAYVNVG